MRELRGVIGDRETHLALAAALAGGPAIVHGSGGGHVGQNIALVIETSGSTGAPKRVGLSPDALLASAAASESALGGSGQWLLALPVNYVAGINVLVRSVVAQLEPVFLPGEHFDAAEFAAAASSMANPRRFTALVPAQLATVLDSRHAASLARFESILLGGQAAPQSLLDRAADVGARITRTYGSSETSGGCVYDGVPIGATRVRVVDGEIWLSGPTLAEGYLAPDGTIDKQRTAHAFVQAEGLRWYRTTDSGEFVEGRLRVSGRLDDVIISGGLKVSLAAVERIIQEVPGLEAAVVTSCAHDRWGSIPVVVSTKPVDLPPLRDIVEGALGVAARPHRVIIVDTLPRLANGKLDRLSLRALAGG